jgi:hypothetical protein
MRKELKTGTSDDTLISLEGCLMQVEASKTWFTRRVLPLSIAQLRWRSDPQRWSIAECLDHVNLTLGLYLPKIDDAIGLGWHEHTTVAQRTPYGPHYEFSEMAALRRVEPPVNSRATAPSATSPSAAVDPDQLVDHFHQFRDQYADAVRRAAGLDLSRILIVNPLDPSIHSLGATLAFVAAHDRRHMWQAEQIRRTPGFPQALFASWQNESENLADEQ